MNSFKRNKAVEEDLAALRYAKNYRKWTFSLVRPYLGNRVLEIGSGIGNYSTFLLDKERVWLSDYDPEYVSDLREKFRSYPNVSSHRLDLARLDETILTKLHKDGLDTVLAMNVLEHVDDDEGAIQALGRYLNSGGRIVLTVPAMSLLFGSLDQAYGHHRRYDREDVKRLLRATGLNLKQARFFNMAAIAGWFWISRIRHLDRLPRPAVEGYDRLIVPIMAKLEAAVPPPIGSSMLIVLER